MCSLNLNSTVDSQIKLAGNQRDFIERRLTTLASEADENTPGLLDELETHRKRLPKGIRKYSFGRHRLYYSGTHKNCSYDACYLVLYKSSDRTSELDDTPSFQKRLKDELANKQAARILDDPKTKSASVDETESWKNADWYREKKKYEELADGEDDEMN